MTILDTILKEKEKEVALLKEQGENYPEALPKKKIPSFYETFQQSKTMSIISEIKRASPSKGDINAGVDPVEQAKLYEENGAGAISVLTDQAFFKGTMDDLYAVRQAVSLPILCKDFVIDRVQIDRAKAYGANIILLIVAALPKEQLKSLYDYARSRDLEVLVEVHNEMELIVAREIGANIIGINNRDLKTFQVSLETTECLADLVEDPSILLISESGIQTRKDAEKVRDSGAKGLLVGETLMRSGDIKKTIEDLKVPYSLPSAY
ncbi:indole-3-glycerol phosphate synthase TrpC [Heyndrickxia acidicola]|uniref:Indole-3-glycerol phosphate synthase n=1 Tax=Heyndrickxia acidicola TaxID=209389 RepID=A0ABU6ML11_9BACI|nr:indole-3-glycerol phosphate synthase TrpC [Heyndrickxia acidicola]MED1204989.1 indole-3-glycerol phosphate synthase TrpC [Heyndrickxia acidicola]